MSESRQSRERPLSFGEEIANSVSHGIGLAMALAATPVLVLAAVQRGSVSGIVGASVFATTMVLVYLTSTLYHAMPRNTLKRVFNMLDRAAIYLLIAGTYTPFTLGVFRGAWWGWTLLVLVWGLALAGLGLMIVRGLRHPRISMALYLIMGWLAVIAAKPIILGLPAWGLFWIAAGGLAYTTGVVFYAAHRLRYNHFVWHLFVIAGTSCHFIAVVWYSA
ncbi:MAG: hemolysin III family protein [Phycisphaerae bacterium]|nr:hemolysin III family protein [Phycisphaerae bacterium]